VRVLSALGLFGSMLSLPSARAAGAQGVFWVKRTLVSTTHFGSTPILHPGVQSVGHFHVFFGSTSVASADSSGSYNTIDSNLEASSSTTCKDSFDDSAVWYPEPFFAGQKSLSGIYVRATT
jgi:Domain of unknown function (DUF1996)